MTPGSGGASAERLLVFVPARRAWPGGARGALTPTSVVSYLALDGDGTMRSGSAALARLPPARTLDLVFDALDVFTTTVEAPRLGEVKLRQALPNLLEERMLGDAADYHFAWAPARTAPATALAGRPAAPAAAGTWLSVSAIDRSTLTRTLDVLRQVQRQPRAAYSEIYTLPAPAEGTAHARLREGRGLLRTDLDQGFGFDLEDGAGGALALVSRQKSIARIRVCGTPAGGLSAAAAALGATADERDHAFDAAATGAAVNLLQGAYATTGTFGFSGRLLARLLQDGAWKAPAAWLGACALIAILGLNAYWFKLESQYRDVRDGMRHAFRDAFPNEPTIVDEVLQAQRSVATLRAHAGRASADDFSVLDAQTLQVFADAPVGIVTAIDYSDGMLVLHFAPGSAENPALRNALQGKAIAQGLNLRFEPDGSARIAPAAGP
jgi:general secretion pathway protein L